MFFHHSISGAKGKGSKDAFALYRGHDNAIYTVASTKNEDYEKISATFLRKIIEQTKSSDNLTHEILGSNIELIKNSFSSLYDFEFEEKLDYGILFHDGESVFFQITKDVSLICFRDGELVNLRSSFRKSQEKLIEFYPQINDVYLLSSVDLQKFLLEESIISTIKYYPRSMQANILKEKLENYANEHFSEYDFSRAVIEVISVAEGESFETENFSKQITSAFSHSASFSDEIKASLEESILEQEREFENYALQEALEPVVEEGSSSGFRDIVLPSLEEDDDVGEELIEEQLEPVFSENEELLVNELEEVLSPIENISTLEEETIKETENLENDYQSLADELDGVLGQDTQEFKDLIFPRLEQIAPDQQAEIVPEEVLEPIEESLDSEELLPEVEAELAVEQLFSSEIQALETLSDLPFFEENVLPATSIVTEIYEDSELEEESQDLSEILEENKYPLDEELSLLEQSDEFYQQAETREFSELDEALVELLEPKESPDFSALQANVIEDLDSDFLDGIGSSQRMSFVKRLEEPLDVIEFFSDKDQSAQSTLNRISELESEKNSASSRSSVVLQKKDLGFSQNNNPELILNANTSVALKALEKEIIDKQGGTNSENEEFLELKKSLSRSSSKYLLFALFSIASLGFFIGPVVKAVSTLRGDFVSIPLSGAGNTKTGPQYYLQARIHPGEIPPSLNANNLIALVVGFDVQWDANKIANEPFVVPNLASRVLSAANPELYEVIKPLFLPLPVKELSEGELGELNIINIADEVALIDYKIALGHFIDQADILGQVDAIKGFLKIIDTQIASLSTGEFRNESQLADLESLQALLEAGDRISVYDYFSKRTKEKSEKFEEYFDLARKIDSQRRSFAKKKTLRVKSVLNLMESKQQNMQLDLDQFVREKLIEERELKSKEIKSNSEILEKLKQRRTRIVNLQELVNLKREGRFRVSLNKLLQERRALIRDYFSLTLPKNVTN